jgi:hypothetical protein
MPSWVTVSPPPPRRRRGADQVGVQVIDEDAQLGVAALVGQPHDVGRELDQPPHLRRVGDRDGHHRRCHGFDCGGGVGGCAGVSLTPAYPIPHPARSSDVVVVATVRPPSSPTSRPSPYPLKEKRGCRGSSPRVAAAQSPLTSWGESTGRARHRDRLRSPGPR